MTTNTAADREPMQHTLKCWAHQFDDVASGIKRAEFRRNDRDYRQGDTLVLQRFDPVTFRLTGQQLTFGITHVLESEFGMPAGYCMLSLSNVVQAEAVRDEREAFEEFMRANSDPARIDDHIAREGGSYVEYPTALAWAAWSDRAHLAARSGDDAVQPQTEWQRIETAPRTGRTLLLGYLNTAGKWRTVRGQWMSEAYIEQNWEEPDDAEAGWYETSAEADDAPNCWPISPTHWMPLPAAPASSAGDQA